jgi:hypothetical protein
MSVVTTKSAQITNRDATPAVPMSGALTRANLKRAMGLVTAVSGDSIASKYLFFQLPSNAIVSSVKVSCPDIGTTGTMDLGLYKTTAQGGAVVDADFFKAAIDVHSGALAKSEVVNGNVITVANMEKRLWEHLGLSSDPAIMYDVVGTLAAAQDAGGAILVEAEYSE